MMRTEAMHKASFYSMEKDLRKFYPNMLPMGAGCCTNLHNQHSIGFHRGKGLVRKAAGSVRTSTGFAFCAAACAYGKHVRIKFPQIFFQAVKRSLMHGFCAHHAFPIHGILQLTNCLYQDSKFILSYSLFAFLQGSAAGRTTPAFVVFVTGIGGAHLTYFWL